MPAVDGLAVEYVVRVIVSLGFRDRGSVRAWVGVEVWYRLEVWI